MPIVFTSAYVKAEKVIHMEISDSQAADLGCFL